MKYACQTMGLRALSRCIFLILLLRFCEQWLEVLLGSTIYKIPTYSFTQCTLFTLYTTALIVEQLIP